VRPWLLLLLACGCAAPPPPPPDAEARPAPPPSPLAGCAEDLSGAWRHRDDDSFRYLARDDGGVLLLEVQHATADGGVEASQLVLVRSPGSFVGAVGVGRVKGDAGCAAFFPVEVVSCADAGLVVSTAERLRVDGACRPVENAVHRLHRLVRLTPDAG